MQDAVTKLLELIEASDLANKDKVRWKKYLPLLPEFTLNEMLAAARENPKVIEWFTKNWREKAAIGEENEKEAWEKLLEQEQKEIDDIMKLP